MLHIVTNRHLTVVTKSIFMPQKKSCTLILTQNRRYRKAGILLKIGRKLKELRTAHGYTQEELSTRSYIRLHKNSTAIS